MCVDRCAVEYRLLDAREARVDCCECVCWRGARARTLPLAQNLSSELNASVVCHFVFRSINEFKPLRVKTTNLNR